MRRVDLACIAVALLAATPNSASAQTLLIETADASASDLGVFNSLVIDALGNPHVSYQKATPFSGDLKYAWKSGGAWSIETVDAPANDVGWYTSLALDASGNPHVSYQDQTTFNLKYARKSGGVWTIETADGSANSVGYFTSVALDVSGNPHVSYQDQTTFDLKYARKSGGVWTLETVDGATSNAGAHSSLALDVSGNPHVSYQDGPAGDLKYARKSGSVWTIEIADGSANVTGDYSSIALDATGNPHVTYQDDTTSDLKYARKSGGLWTIETVDESTPEVGWFSSLALDVSGNPHVSYFDFWNGDLRYARKSGGVWIVETLEASANVVGWNTSLAMDAAGNPHVSYSDATLGNLKYAYVPSIIVTSPSPGLTWPVGSQQTVRWYLSGGLALGNSDVHLSIDGGNSFTQIRNSARDPEIALRVPHTPTRYASIKIVRPSPYIEAHLDSFFTIDATIALNKFDARVVSGAALGTGNGSAVALSWQTTPGREADVRYRLERAARGDESSPTFKPLHDEPLDADEYLDALDNATDPSTRYRLIAINGLDEEFALGEAVVAHSLAPDVDLVAMPNTSRTGEILFRFRVESPRLDTEVALFDVSGRRVRVLTSGSHSAGVSEIVWDGRDDRGTRVPAGVYFARLLWGGVSRAKERVTVVR